MKIEELIKKEEENSAIWIINDRVNDPLNWLLTPLNDSLIPQNGYYLVNGIFTSNLKSENCWLSISTPEMIVDFTFLINSENLTIDTIDYHTIEDQVVPCKLSDCFATYELYYSRTNPRIGIQILKSQLENVNEKGYIYEYLGYIYRDENRISESIQYFTKAIEIGPPSSSFVYDEISQLYEKIGELEMARKYLKMKIE